MLLPDKVIPFLIHHNPLVRAQALRYFDGAHDPSPATADDLWKSIDQFGGGKHDASYAVLKSMPQTEASLNRTLSAIASNDHLQQLAPVLANLPYGLLLRFRDLIDDATLPPELRQHLNHRFELATVPGTDLWEQLNRLGEKESSDAHDEANRVIEALARSPEYAGYAINVLNDPRQHGWIEVYCLELLGRSRYRPSVGVVADKLIKAKSDNVALIRSAVDSLVRIGGVDVCTALRQRWPQMVEWMRNSAAGVLRRIKLAQSESLAIALLSQETKQTVRTTLAEVLCGLATTDAATLDRLGETVKSGDWDHNMLELNEHVAGLFGMMGREVPRSGASARPAFRASPVEAALNWDDDHDEEISGQSHRAPQPITQGITQSTDAPPPVVVPRKPLKREASRVGRNDPCPCGSGKKYKKCCGK